MKVVTIFESMSFAKEMQSIAGILAIDKGWCVLQCVYDLDFANLTSEDLNLLKKEHLKRIELADAVYVVNIDGYIGNSTRLEIVYATKDMITVLFFAAKGHGMFDGWIADGRLGVPTYYEAYPNSLKDRYWGKSSFCYYLTADKFTNATGDPCDVVCEEAVDIIGFEEIKDIGLEFEKLEKEGKIKFVWYNESPENSKEVCEKRALQLLIDRGYFEGKEFRQREWASKYYKDLIEKFENKRNL